MRSSRLLVFAVASVLALSACAAEPTDNTAEPAPAEQAPDTSPPDSSATGDDDYPVLRFVAHGEGAPNTYGPSCAVGIETSSTNVFRVTAPDGWTHRGGLGGSGRTTLDFDVDGVQATIYFAASTNELVQHPNLEFGSLVGSVELPGATAELVEVTDLGTGSSELTGYGITEVPWLTNLPEGWFSSELTMTIFATSPDPAVPAIEDATELLSSLRVERCAGIEQAIIFYSSSNLLAVPHVENDPLGKSFPGGDQPKFDPSPLDVWTVEQLAYLLPLPAPADRCAAQKLQDPSVRATLPPLFSVSTFALAPRSDTDKAALVELSESC